MSEIEPGTIQDLLAELVACAGVFDVSTNYEADKVSLEKATQAVLEHVRTLRDERDRLRTRALTAVERWRAQTNVKEGIAFRMAMKALEAALTPARGREEVTMILVQWFFTVWVGGVPHEVGPFVNETQCENMVQAYMDGGPFGGYVPPYRPVCTKKEFELKVRP